MAWKTNLGFMSDAETHFQWFYESKIIHQILLASLVNTTLTDPYEYSKLQ